MPVTINSYKRAPGVRQSTVHVFYCWLPLQPFCLEREEERKELQRPPLLIQFSPDDTETS